MRLCRTPVTRDRLEREAVDMRYKIGEQMETIAGLRQTKNEPEREIGNAHSRVQAQNKTIDREKLVWRRQRRIRQPWWEVKPHALC